MLGPPLHVACTLHVFMLVADSFGSIQVAELDWGNEDHIRAVDPPFDYIIGTDVVSLFGDYILLNT